MFSLGLQVDSSYRVLSYFLYPAKETRLQGGRIVESYNIFNADKFLEFTLDWYEKYIGHFVDFNTKLLQQLKSFQAEAKPNLLATQFSQTFKN